MTFYCCEGGVLFLKNDTPSNEIPYSSLDHPRNSESTKNIEGFHAAPALSITMAEVNGGGGHAVAVIEDVSIATGRDMIQNPPIDILEIADPPKQMKVEVRI